MTERFQTNPHPDEQAGTTRGGFPPPEEQPHLTIEQPGTDRPGTRIEVFTGAVRMTGPSFSLEVRGGDFAYQASGDKTVFTGTGPDQEQLLFGIRRDGAVLFRSDPKATQTPQTTEQAPESQPVPQPSVRAAATRHTAPATPPEGHSPTDQEPPARDVSHDAERRTAETEEEQRVQLTGRLGRSPSFRTAKNGTLVAKFPIAVHHEDGRTSWRTVLAFGERAKQLKTRMEAGELLMGREVDVVGYLHENTRQGKNGPRTVQEIYAVAVKKR